MMVGDEPCSRVRLDAERLGVACGLTLLLQRSACMVPIRSSPLANRACVNASRVECAIRLEFSLIELIEKSRRARSV